MINSVDFRCSERCVNSDVTGHWSNTLDNQCGAPITDSSASGASLPLCKCAEEGETTRDSLVVGKSKTVLNIIKS